MDEIFFMNVFFVFILGHLDELRTWNTYEIRNEKTKNINRKPHEKLTIMR
jgi:hypothetical protein